MRQTEIEDLVGDVVESRRNGLYLAADLDGLARVVKVLIEKKVVYRLHESMPTAEGLVDALRKAPTAIHVFQAAMPIDPELVALLHAAGSSEEPRWLEWRTGRTTIRFCFAGAIVLLKPQTIDESSIY